MSEKNVFNHYLNDLGPIIMERALEAKAQAKSAKPGADKSFQEGRLIAFNEVVSIMQQQAQGLGISLTDLRLDGVVPDRDLV